MSADDVVIHASHVGRSFGLGDAARRAVDDVSFEIRRGEVVLIYGPSGCGKSTLLALCGGLDRTYSGTLRVLDQDLARIDDRELSALRGRRIGFVFQAFHLLSHLTVLENVTLPALFADDPLGPEVDQLGREVLERVGLVDRANASPAELSGGQRQRVAIARALLRRPEILLCDEPTGNLDRRTGEQIVELFAQVHADLGTTMLVVTHEDRLNRIATRTLSMLDGKLDGRGSAEGGESAA